MSEEQAERWLSLGAVPGALPWLALRRRRARRRLEAAVRRADPTTVEVLRRAARQAPRLPRRHARLLIAEGWAATRAPQLRRLLLETDVLTPAENLPLLAAAALRGPRALAAHWPPAAARCAPALLTDPDPAVRAAAEGCCRHCTGPLLAALWDTVPGMDPVVGVGTAGTVDSEPMDQPLPALLLRNPAPPPPGRLDALWAAWLRPSGAPDERVLAALTVWRLPAGSGPDHLDSSLVIEPDTARLTAKAATRAALLAAAGRTDHPLGALARQRILAAGSPELYDAVCEAAQHDPALVPFCLEHRLAPRDPVRRVVFFLLTGQLEQYRGMDPDGRLLELAYAAATAAVRAGLQRAMRTAGGLDLVRILAGSDRRSRIPELSGDEIRYLAEQLADRGEWPRLWALVQDVPLPTGLGLMRLFDAGAGRRLPWAPPDEDGRLLWERMRRAGTDARGWQPELRKLSSTMPPAARIRFHGRINSLSFAPDAPLLAVAGTNRVAGVIDLAEGRLTERYDGFISSVGHIVHTGGGAFVAAERSNTKSAPLRVLRCQDGRQQVLQRVTAPVTALTLSRPDGSFAGAVRDGRLLLGARDGTVRFVPVQHFGVDPKHDWPRAVTAHLPTGRLALLGRSLTLTDGDGEGVLARGGADVVIGRAVFTAPQELVVASKRGTVARMRRQGELLLPDQINAGVAAGLVALPDREQVVLVDRRGQLTVLDATTLKLAWQSGRPRAEPGTRPQATSADLSPSGEILAVGYHEGFTDLYDLRAWALPALLNRPLVSCVPAHLGVVAAALASEVRFSAAARQTLELIQDLLRHRFRFDIELSDAGVEEGAGISLGEYEISL